MKSYKKLVLVDKIYSAIDIDTEKFENWLHFSEERWLARDSFCLNKVRMKHVKKELSGRTL